MDTWHRDVSRKRCLNTAVDTRSNRKSGRSHNLRELKWFAVRPFSGHGPGGHATWGECRILNKEF